MKQAIYLSCFLLLIVACSRKIRADYKSTQEMIPDLNGAWVLLEVNGLKVTKDKSGKELPYLEFNTSLNSLSGSTGCNRISGKAVVGSFSVDFVSLVSTRMHCINANYETAMLQLLRGSLSFKVENDRLIFSKEGKQILVLQK